MASSMARVYASACEREYKPKNFNTVPERILDEVRSIIEADGYIINEDGTVVKPDPKIGTEEESSGEDYPETE